MNNNPHSAIADTIRRPTLLLDEARVRRNIARMIDRAAERGVVLRHHAKTHQSAEIGGWFKELGATALTVSSLEMAAYFADHGWDDILVAFPVNLREIETIKPLAERIRLGLLVDAEVTVAALEANLDHALAVWLKIDAGYGRAGLPWSDMAAIERVARAIHRTKHLLFAGLLIHSGHSYHAGSPAAVREIHTESIHRLQTVQRHLGAVVDAPCLLSVGDTPTCSLAEDFSGVAEIRPGNFVFFDLMQLQLGSCRAEDLAVAVACPVVGKYAARSEIVIYGGAVHLGSAALTESGGRPIYGYLTLPTGQSLGTLHPQTPLIALSQEHGVVRLPADLFAQIEIADLVYVSPIHSCLTCNLHPGYLTLAGRWIPRR